MQAVIVKMVLGLVGLVSTVRVRVRLGLGLIDRYAM